MVLIELVAAVFILRWAIHWLVGAGMALVLVVALAVQGVWLPLAFLVVVVALMVGIIRRIARVDTPARRVGDLATGYRFDAPSGLRAVYGDRLDRTRRWASR
jgi:hypothetical protein